MSEFDTRRYWESRLTRVSLDTVGYKGLGLAYNGWLYRMKERQLLRCLRRHNVSARGGSVLDVGAGSGFYIDFWHRQGAGHIVGIDIAEPAVSHLRACFPLHTFHHHDVSSHDPTPIAGRTYDIISAFDVLYHIVDDEAFESAMANLGKLSPPGGIFLLSDTFTRYSRPVVLDHLKSRSMQEYKRALARNGFRIQACIPVFHAMIPPTDVRHPMMARFYRTLWQTLHRASRIHGGLSGRLAYHIDSLLHLFPAEGPSTKIMLCRRA